MRGSLQGLGGVFTILFFIPIGIAWLLAKKKEKDGWSGFFKMILAIMITLYAVSDFTGEYKENTIQIVKKYGIIDSIKGKPVSDDYYNAGLENWNGDLLGLAETVFHFLIIVFLIYSSSKRSRELKKANAVVVSS